MASANGRESSKKLTDVPRNILLVSARKTVEILDVDVSIHRGIHARCSIFMSCIVTPIGGYGNFAHIPRGREWFKRAWLFSWIPWIGTCYNQHSLPETSSTGTIMLKKNWKITQESKGTIFTYIIIYIYFILCFNMLQLSAILWRIGANRCSISLYQSTKGKRWPWGCRRILRRSKVASEGVPTQNLKEFDWPQKDMSTFKVQWLKMYHFSYF